MMDDETKQQKISEFLEATLPKLSESLEKFMTGDKWILKQVMQIYGSFADHSWNIPRFTMMQSIAITRLNNYAKNRP